MKDDRQARQISVIPRGLHQGTWHADVECDRAPPKLEVRHLGRALDGVGLLRAGDHWQLTVPVPAEALNDGVQSFVVAEEATGEVLAGFAIAAGQALEGDMRAELELLRAELDLLKRAFRRHCAENE